MVALQVNHQNGYWWLQNRRRFVTSQVCYSGYMRISGAAMVKRQIETIEIVGGHLAIDFVNTVSNWNSGDRTDFLGDYEDLVRFALRQELIGEKTAARFCGRPEAEREAALAEARRFRDSVHAILLARAEDRALPAEALGHLNALVRELVQWREIRAQGSGICCAWRFEDAPAQALL